MHFGASVSQVFLFLNLDFKISLDTSGSHRRDPPVRCLGRILTRRNRSRKLTTAVMASAHIKLDPQATEAIARRVVELLERRGLQRRELVDAAELARRFGIERSWVYSHAIELGAVKLGNGSKPRLRFDPEVAARVLRKVGEAPAADPPARSGKRAGQPPRAEKAAGLLPIAPGGKTEPPSAA